MERIAPLQRTRLLTGLIIPRSFHRDVPCPFAQILRSHSVSKPEDEEKVVSLGDIKIVIRAKQRAFDLNPSGNGQFVDRLDLIPNYFGKQSEFNSQELLHALRWMMQKLQMKQVPTHNFITYTCITCNESSALNIFVAIELFRSSAY
jgi:hypothetical protein